MKIATEELQIENRISHQLTGTVIGGLTAAIGPVDGVGE